MRSRNSQPPKTQQADRDGAQRRPAVPSGGNRASGNRERQTTPLRDARRSSPGADLPSKPAAKSARKPRREAAAENWLYGRHAVAAALANPQRRWRSLAVLAGQQDEATSLVAAARAERRGTEAAIEVLDRAELEAILPEGAVHQGLALEIEPLDPADLDDLLRAVAVSDGGALIVMLDQVSDPHNVGAILRSAAAFGAAAVIVAEHGAPPASATLAKAASGALDLVKLVRVVNLARALDRLKEAGFWSCGLDETAPTPLSALDLGERVVLVLGSEGGGLRRLVRERCDMLARLPTRPDMPSLNVSNAAAVALYELIRRAASEPK